MIPLGILLYKIAFLTFTIAFGGVFYQHVVEFRNWNADIPDSLNAYRNFFRYSDFGKFFRMFMPIATICLVSSSFMLRNIEGGGETWVLACTTGCILTAVFTATFFIPKHRKLFHDPIDERDYDELNRIADQWKSANYFRMFLMAITVICFLEGMKLLNN